MAFLLLGLSGCFGNPFSRTGTAPESLDNACAIVQERPNYLRAFVTSERTYGVPVATQMAIIYQESKFISNARPPKQYFMGFVPTGRASSARGYSQALDGTWEDYMRDTGRWRASRRSIRDSADFIGWYASRARHKNGIAPNDTHNLYLAYHEGHLGYRRGDHYSKQWLLQVASQTANRAVKYDRQLRSCGMI